MPWIMGFKTHSQESLKPRIRFIGLLSAAAAVSCAATFASFFGGFWWPFELMTHFPAQYLITLVVGGAIFALSRRRWWAAVCLVFAAPSLICLAPQYIPGASFAVGKTELTAALMNVSVTNEEYGKALGIVRSYNPDFLVAEEVDHHWLDNLSKGLSDYPYRLARTRDDQFGIAMFSRIPFEDCAIIELGKLGYPAIRARITVDGKPLTICALHPPPPLCAGLRRERRLMMERLAKVIGNEGPCLVLGDLNATVWSPILRDFMKKTGLRDGRAGFGIVPTWPARFPCLLIPIDHCLVSEDVMVSGFQSGPGIGSDHYPVIVRFGLRAGPVVPDVPIALR